MTGEKIKILLVDDNPADARLFKEMLADSGSADDFPITYAKKLDEALAYARKGGFDIVLLDLILPDSQGLDTFHSMYKTAPDLPIVVLTGLSDETIAAKAVRDGAQDYLVKGQGDANLLIRAMRFAIERKRLIAENGGAKKASPNHKNDERNLKVIGNSDSLKKVEELISIIAKTSNTSVLLHGETGTGKGLVANAIHLASNRKNNPFIELNCSAIPDNLLETEMFGYEKGAFTDAKQSKKGLFELADGGTIFLDEIGDMDIRLQPKLLQFLESRTFRKVGGTKDIKVDLRVIAATNKDLEAMVGEKRFREDLYYRLKVMVVNIPPLRERKDDIIPLTEYFIKSYSERSDGPVKMLSPECHPLLLKYQWPGNIRELKNAIERAVIVSGSGNIMPEHLPQELRREKASNSHAATPELPHDMSLEELEKAHIRNVLEKAGGNKSEASRILGISRLTLRKKLKDYGLEE